MNGGTEVNFIDKRPSLILLLSLYPAVFILFTHDEGQSVGGRHLPNGLSTDHFSPRPVVRCWSHFPL